MLLLGAFGPMSYRESLVKLQGSAFQKAQYPQLYQDDVREKNMQAQEQTAVRLPFGPNPHAHEITAMAMLDNQKYKNNYQQQQKTMHVENQMALLDPMTSGPTSTGYKSTQNPEYSFSAIGDFWSKRSQETPYHLSPFDPRP